jgi:hypothetical protein
VSASGVMFHNGGETNTKQIVIFLKGISASGYSRKPVAERSSLKWPLETVKWLINGTSLATEASTKRRDTPSTDTAAGVHV